MKNYAQLENGIVVNVIIAEDSYPWEDDLEHLDVTNHIVHIGMTREEALASPTKPIVPDIVPYYGTRVTRLALRNRFTGGEKAALYTAAETSIPIKIYLDDLAAATYVDLARADTIASINSLVGTILTQERATAILTDPVQPEEVPVQ